MKKEKKSGIHDQADLIIWRVCAKKGRSLPAANPSNLALKRRKQELRSEEGRKGGIQIIRSRSTALKPIGRKGPQVRNGGASIQGSTRLAERAKMALLDKQGQSMLENRTCRRVRLKKMVSGNRRAADNSYLRTRGGTEPGTRDGRQRTEQ